MSHIWSNRTATHLPPCRPFSSCPLDLMGHPFTLQAANARLMLSVPEPASLREDCKHAIESFFMMLQFLLFSLLCLARCLVVRLMTHVVEQLKVTLPVFNLAHQLCSMLHSSVRMAYVCLVHLNANFVERYSRHGQCCPNPSMVVLCLLEVRKFLL